MEEELKNTSEGLSARIAAALVKIEDNRGSVNSLSKKLKKTAEYLYLKITDVKKDLPSKVEMEHLKITLKNLTARITSVRKDLSTAVEEVKKTTEDLSTAFDKELKKVFNRFLIL